MQSDIKTKALVLRRTNYGEADRIINFITPEGKISAIAKGVRKEKSKLAGGMELFSLIQINIHQGKSEIGVVTSAKMLKFYNALLKDYDRMQLAALILKKINAVAENSNSADYFDLTLQSLEALNNGTDIDLVESWFLLNISKASGEEINLYRDVSGDRLKADRRYAWNAMEKAFQLVENGEFGADEIKALRLMLAAKLVLISRVKGISGIQKQILMLARTFHM